MTVLYSIRNWDKNFETAQSRKVEGPLNWVALPTKHDGLGFKKILTLDDGPAVYGAWVLMVQVAAKCPKRGVLKDETGPLSVDDIALKTSCPKSVVERALKVLSDNGIGWVVVAEWYPDTSRCPLHNTTQQDSTEQNKTSAPPEGGCPSELFKLIAWWNDLRGKSLVSHGVKSDPPLSEAVVRGWSRVKGSALLREKLADLERLTGEIEAAPFCREGWFRFEKLLGGKNRDQEYIVVKLLDGGYRNGKPASTQPRAQRYQGT